MRSDLFNKYNEAMFETLSAELHLMAEDTVDKDKVFYALNNLSEVANELVAEILEYEMKHRKLVRKLNKGLEEV